MALRAAELDEDAMLDGSVGQALSLRGPFRPANAGSPLRLRRSTPWPGGATKGDENGRRLIGFACGGWKRP